MSENGQGAVIDFADREQVKATLMGAARNIENQLSMQNERMDKIRANAGSDDATVRASADAAIVGEIYQLARATMEVQQLLVGAVLNLMIGQKAVLMPNGPIDPRFMRKQ